MFTIYFNLWYEGGYTYKVKMVFTVEQKINIIKWYCRAESAEEVVGRFIFAYPDEQIPTAKTIYNIWHKFEQSGCVNRCAKCSSGDQEPRRTPDARIENEVNVCAFVEISEPCSSSQISEELDIPSRTVRDILKRNKYKAYKIKNTQEIFPEDQIKRMEFCETLREKIDQNDDFTSNILFTDESSFPLLGRHNSSVVRYWSRENLHLSVPLRTQYPEKVNVWAGILDNHIVGPFFIDGTLNSERYLLLLQQNIIPAVRNLDVNFNEIWFQQDGCPAHNARQVQNYLTNTFPGRLISTRGTIPWPPRSPDLTPCDYFLWGYLKEILYQHRHERAVNLDELRLRIINISRSITPEMLANVDIEVNGETLDIHMKLGESGEAFFVEELEDDEDNEIPEHLATSPIPVSEIENIFKNQGRRRSFNLDDIDLNNEPNTYEKRRYTADTELANNRVHLERDFLKRQIGLGNIDGGVSAEDVTYSLTTVSRKSDEDDLSRSQNDVSETIFKMDSLDEPLNKGDLFVSEKNALQEEKLPSKSNEFYPGESKNSKKKRKKMRKKNAARKSMSNNFLTSPENLDNANSSTTDRSSLDSNCSEPELKDLQLQTEKTDKESIEPQNDNSNIKKLEADFHFFSDTELTSGNVESRSSSPVNVESVQSDSEIEIKRVKDESNEPSKSWEWGGFPSVSQTNSPTSENPTKEEQKSMLSSVFSFMKSKHNAQTRYAEGGVYLSDITSGGIDQEAAQIYFSQKKDRTTEDIDMDCESGNGPSLTQSPNSPEGCKSIDSDFEEHAKLIQAFSHDITLSLCGWDQEITPDRFNERLISFTDFCNNPVLLDDPKLVVKISGKYYSWKVAAPMLVSILCFGRPLLESCVDQLCNTYMSVPEVKDKPTEDKMQTNKSSWWYWRRSRSSRETTPAKEDHQNKTVDTKESSVSEAAEELSEVKVEPIKEPEKQSEEKKDTNINISTGSLKSTDKCRKTLRLSSKQIASLNLKDGVNEVEFSVTTAYQGTSRCKCHLYKWKWDDKIVISDIDGTITKSDVLGHILPIVGKDWAQSGVAQLFNKIKDNGYKLLYLSARAIGQARITREYLRSIKQGDMSMPDGPILLNPTSLINAFHREVIEKKPEAFKISCLSDIKALFSPDSEPFYAGYGNRINDVWAYRAVGIPIHRIFTINPKGELKHELTQTFQSSYTGQSLVVNEVFPPLLEKIQYESESESDFNDEGCETDSESSESRLR